MDKIKLLKESLESWKKHTEDSPNFYPWISEDISFLIRIEERVIEGNQPIQNEDEKEKLIDLIGDAEKGGFGTISGIAFKDMPICETSHYLHEVQRIAVEMKKNYVDKKKERRWYKPFCK